MHIFALNRLAVMIQCCIEGDVMTVYPDYYKDFECIKGACQHNCCIGWEIEIDSDTKDFYSNVEGELGQRLKQNIDWAESCFILGKNERCPFLNKENLCDIILTLGEDKLCGICADHPRFRNLLPDRTEIGLGLCCEAAADLILRQKHKVGLIYDGDSPWDDSIINLRDAIIDTLQDREFTIFERLNNMLWLCGEEKFEFDINSWTQRLYNLERLDDEWSQRLDWLKKPIDFDGFTQHVKCNEEEYEQLAVYFIYRHFANAPDSENCLKRAKFAALAVNIIFALGAAEFTKNGKLNFDQRVDIARAFSSEIEYSDENLYAIIDSL